MAERRIAHRKSSLVLFARFPVVKWRSRSVAKSAYYIPNHNYNKIVKSDWLSTAPISALNGQFNRTVRVMPTRSSNFVNHSYDYRPNWTPLSPVTITNRLSLKI